MFSLPSQVYPEEKKEIRRDLSKNTTIISMEFCKTTILWNDKDLKTCLILLSCSFLNESFGLCRNNWSLNVQIIIFRKIWILANCTPLSDHCREQPKYSQWGFKETFEFHTVMKLSGETCLTVMVVVCIWRHFSPYYAFGSKGGFLEL